ncbi:MAG: hypothetical protein KGH75_06855 [Rhodospirillales bacterium]|nr:hypothetical protein [Rhodospirillales bacterium]
MSMSTSTPAPTAKPFGIQDQMTSNQQQSLPVAYVAGTRKVAAKWFTPIYNLRSAPAPNKIPSKK